MNKIVRPVTATSEALSDNEAIEIIQGLGIQLGSIQILYEQNKNGEFKKSYGKSYPPPYSTWKSSPAMIAPEKERHEPVFVGETSYKKNDKVITQKTYNGFNCFYAKTGEENDIMVLDLDDLEDEHCKKMQKMAEKECQYTVKTRKGFHYYFKYDESMKTINGKTYGVPFDLLSEGSKILSPPGKYNKRVLEGDVWNTDSPAGAYVIYNVTGYPISEMSDKLKKYILDLIPATTKATPKKKPAKKKRVMDDEDEDDDEKECTLEKELLVERMINGFLPHRSIDFGSWQKAGYIFKNEGLPVELFKKFSKKYYKKYDADEVETYFDSLSTRDDSLIGTEGGKLSLGTFWHWLLIDNEPLYRELRSLYYQNSPKLEFEMNEPLKPNQSTKNKYVVDGRVFSLNTFMDLIKMDERTYADSHYYEFENTSAYKYYNHFHIWMSQMKCIFLLDPINPPQPFEVDCYPNINIIQYINGEKPPSKKEVVTEDDMDDIDIGVQKKKYHSFLKMWTTSSKCRVAQSFEFDPNPEKKTDSTGNTVNLFTGFHMETKNNKYEYDESVIEHFFTHLMWIVNDDKEVYEYLLNWVAHIIQMPHKKTMVMPILYSATQGVGKNLFTDCLDKIFGKYYLALGDTKEFANNFNSHMQNKLLGVIDEMNMRARDLSNELKNIITRKTIWIEYKGKNKYALTDYLNYLATTNNENIIQMPKGERRHMVVHCREEKVKKREIMNMLDIINNEERHWNLYTYFKNRDITNFEPREFPMTEYKRQLIINDLPAYIKMIKYKPDQYAGEELTSKELYTRSVRYAMKNKLPHTYTDQKCYKELKEYFGMWYCKRNDQRVYAFPDTLELEIDEIIDKNVKGSVDVKAIDEQSDTESECIPEAPIKKKTTKSSIGMKLHIKLKKDYSDLDSDY